MKNFFLAIAASTLLFSASVFSATPVWTVNFIKEVYPQSSGEFILILKNSSPNCTAINQYHHVKVGENGMTQEGADKIFASALAAGAAQKEVAISFDKDSASCYVNRMSVRFQQ